MAWVGRTAQTSSWLCNTLDISLRCSNLSLNVFNSDLPRTFLSMIKTERRKTSVRTSLQQEIIFGLFLKISLRNKTISLSQWFDNISLQFRALPEVRF